MLYQTQTYNTGPFLWKVAQEKTEPGQKIVQMFTSVDPLADKYPHVSPFAYCENNPLKYIDPSGMGPIGTLPLPILSPEYAKKVEKVGTEAARGTANSILFIGGLAQSIVGNIISIFTTNNEYPDTWATVPIQINQNWSFEKKNSWMGSDGLGNTSIEDNVDMLSNTVGAFFLTFPFSNSVSKTTEMIENTAIGTGITIITNEGADAAKKSSSNTKNETSTTKSNTPSKDSNRFRRPQSSSDIKFNNIRNNSTIGNKQSENSY